MPVCRTLGLGIASEKGNSDHATKYISRLDPFSAGVLYLFFGLLLSQIIAGAAISNALRLRKVRL